MDSGLLNKINRLTDDEKIAFRRKTVIFSFFLVLAVVLWLMNALSKTYLTDIQYPVRYSDIPAGKVLVGDAPEYLTLKVNTHGYRIVRHMLSSRYLPINFPVSSFSLRKVPGAESDLFYIRTSFSREQLAGQLSSDFNIVGISPDTIFFRFATITTRKLPVKPDLIFEPDRQMIIKGRPSSTPDSVLVSGPDYILDTLNGIFTEQKNLGLLSKSFEGNIRLKSLKHITAKYDEVKVRVGVERITSKVLMVPLEIINLPDSISMKTFPNMIEVNCNVGLSNFPGLQPELFRIVADYEESKSGSGRLGVNLTKSPDFVRAVKYSPESVEFLIEK